MVQQPILLKTARPGDVGNLATIAAETFRDTFSGMMPVDDLNRYLHEAFLPDKMKLELLDAGNNFTLAYFDTKELVGYSKLRRHQRPSSLVAVNPMEMERLYIKREFQQMKIGSLLLENAIMQSMTKGCDVLWLAVWEKNEHAISFYRKWRFEEFDKQIFMRGSDAQTGVLMKLVL